MAASPPWAAAVETKNRSFDLAALLGGALVAEEDTAPHQRESGAVGKKAKGTPFRGGRGCPDGGKEGSTKPTGCDRGAGRMDLISSDQSQPSDCGGDFHRRRPWKNPRLTHPTMILIHSLLLLLHPFIRVLCFLPTNKNTLYIYSVTESQTN
jgi:hypothetical protein